MKTYDTKLKTGEKICALRKNQGISQELLSEKTHVSLRTIQRIEKGGSMPRLYTLKVIADVLGVTIAQLNSSDGDLKDSGSPALAKAGLMNLLALSGIIIPLANIAVPFAIWRKYEHLPYIKEVGKRIISFQIVWTLITIVALPLIYVLNRLLTGSFVTGRIPVFVITYLILVTINMLCTILSGIRLKRDITDIYPYMPILF